MTSKASFIQVFVVLLAGLALTGCTTTRPLDSTIGLSKQIEPGDHLIVYENTGRRLDMTLQSVAKDRLTGTLREDDSATVEVLFTAIEKMEVERIDGQRTTTTVGGILLTAVLLIGLSEMPYPGIPQ